MNYFKLLYMVCLIGLSSCEESGDKVSKPKKDGTIEYVITNTMLPDGRFLLKTETKVFAKDTLSKQIVCMDTLPSLGTITTEGEDSLGNVKKFTLPKEYEFYITVQ